MQDLTHGHLAGGDGQEREHGQGAAVGSEVDRDTAGVCGVECGTLNMDSILTDG